MVVRENRMTSFDEKSVSGGKIGYNAANGTWTVFNDETGVVSNIDLSRKDAEDYDIAVNNRATQEPRIMSNEDKWLYAHKAHDYLRSIGARRGLNGSWLNRYYK